MLNCFNADNQCGSLIIKRLLATPLRTLLITKILHIKGAYNNCLFIMYISYNVLTIKRDI